MAALRCAPQTAGEKKRSGHSDSNGFAGHINLPDLVQQSHSPAGTPTEGLGRVSTHSQEMDTGTEVGAGFFSRMRTGQTPCSVWVGFSYTAVDTDMQVEKPQMRSSEKFSDTVWTNVCFYR